MILHPLEWHGEAFKLLGCMIDPDMRMRSAVEQVLSKIRPKITAILRTRGYYSTPNLMFQFKTHIWRLIETNMGAYFHACSSLLEKIDAIQNRFLRELDMTPEHAFLEYAFAPPSLRRNIDALDFLHKRVLGKSHACISNLLPFWTDQPECIRARGHTKKLYDHSREIHFQSVMYANSIFALIVIYNNLPQHVVDVTTVNAFQKYLTHIAERAASLGILAGQIPSADALGLILIDPLIMMSLSGLPLTRCSVHRQKKKNTRTYYETYLLIFNARIS